MSIFEGPLLGIVIMVFVLLVVVSMAGWISGTATPTIQRQQDIALYCKDWVASGCSSSDATLNDPRFTESNEKVGLLNACAAIVGKSAEEFPDEINPEADWNKCRTKCPGCPSKAVESGS